MVSGERGLRANWRGQVGETRIDCKASTLENTRVLRDTACNTLDGYNARHSKLGLRRAQAPNENTRHRRRSWQRANNGGAKNDCLTCSLFNPFYFTTVFSDLTKISDLCLKFNFCAKLRTNVNGYFNCGYCEIEFLKKKKLSIKKGKQPKFNQEMFPLFKYFVTSLLYFFQKDTQFLIIVGKTEMGEKTKQS